MIENDSKKIGTIGHRPVNFGVKGRVLISYEITRTRSESRSRNAECVFRLPKVDYMSASIGIFRYLSDQFPVPILPIIPVADDHQSLLGS